MDNKINRREFLRLASLFFLTGTLNHFIDKRVRKQAGTEGRPNVLIIVFDALSASNTSFYGYSRSTMPRLSEMLDRAIVYHNHYSGGNFTTPGTASLLTGTLPWTHRAFQLNESVLKSLQDHNIFNAFSSPGYYRFSYTHNIFAESVILRFKNDIENLIPRLDLFLTKDLVSQGLKNDYDIASLSRDLIFEKGNDVSVNNSLFLPEIFSKIIRRIKEIQIDKFSGDYFPLFPRGLPESEGGYFMLEDGIDFLIEYLQHAPEPFFGYVHFLPPHYPYSPREEFTKLFNIDDFTGPEKKEHIFSQKEDADTMRLSRLYYDQNIAYVDAEFSRLLKQLDNAGVFENTWLIFTSDHGEMFERGIIAHETETLFNPIIKVPLLLFEPGHQKRRDIFTPTSSIDILPTLLHVTGQAIPDWIEGVVMPPFNSSQVDLERSIFSVQARHNGRLNPLREASVMMLKDPYKLHAYFGYKQLPGDKIRYELYDLENDPEELENIVSSRSSIAQDMRRELLKKIEEVNKPYL
jgi:arylsulfatase A-like enzyme